MSASKDKKRRKERAKARRKAPPLFPKQPTEGEAKWDASQK
jgi:hypothetical protein